MASEKTPQPSAVEVFKHDSLHLRGEIAGELVDENDFFGKGSIQLLKHHGTYQQDDRDVRGTRDEDGKRIKRFIFMVRSKIPSGIVTSEQLLAQLDLCDEIGNSTLRITSRQGLQLHGVLKNDLATSIQRINETQLTTWGACGDINRNVMCCPAPYKDQPHVQMQKTAMDLAEHFAPKTGAYHDIWLTDTDTGEKQLAACDSEATLSGYTGDDVEPIYGKQYLPRKFKMGIALPEDNCIDLYTHDLGLLGIVRDGKLVGYNLIVGGGQGRTPSAEKTFPRLGDPLTFVTLEQVLDVAAAIVKVQRDHGNRSDRKVARMKYLIHNWGIEKFKSKVEEYYGSSLPDPEPDVAHEVDDHMGWHEQGDGNLFYGLNVENGRIKDTDTFKLKTALREICTQFNPGIRLTAHQSIIFSDVAPENRDAIEQILRVNGIPLSEDISNTRRWSMACVAWPTCGLSITESERALPSLIDELESALDDLGLSDERFTLRMTGCPNGCARPYNPDIGLVGRAKDKYTVFVGGTAIGNRLSFIHKDLVPSDEVVPGLVKLFEYFKSDRQGGESFGDFCHRQGNDNLLAHVDGQAV